MLPILCHDSEKLAQEYSDSSLIGFGSKAISACVMYCTRSWLLWVCDGFGPTAHHSLLVVFMLLRTSPRLRQGETQWMIDLEANRVCNTNENTGELKRLVKEGKKGSHGTILVRKRPAGSDPSYSSL